MISWKSTEKKLTIQYRKQHQHRTHANVVGHCCTRNNVGNLPVIGSIWFHLVQNLQLAFLVGMWIRGKLQHYSPLPNLDNRIGMWLDWKPNRVGRTIYSHGRRHSSRNLRSLHHHPIWSSRIDVDIRQLAAIFPVLSLFLWLVTIVST